MLTALIAYLHYEAPVEEQNFATLLEMLNTMQVLEDDEEYQNPVDLLFEELAKKKPNSFAGRQYKLYKLAAGKTAKSILISCGARLAPFDIQELRDLTMYDELQLDTLGDKKTALFLIMSDTDSTFNFLISMVYTQLFNLLCDKADDVYGGKLPIHVRCLIDECANIGQIPQLEKLVATIRSREISACLVLQAKSQLKAIYKDNADTIIGNMDSQIFLGGSEPGTLKDLSEILGKETIDSFNTSDTRGNSPSYGTSFQKLGHELLSRDELAVLDGGKCILQLRGVRPFLSDKYDLTQHPNYKFLHCHHLPCSRVILAVMLCRGLSAGLFCGRFIGHRQHQQTVAQFQKGFRLMEKLLILLRQFRGQGCKILLTQPHHEKSPGNSIIHFSVFIPQGTVQRQSHELAVIGINDGNRVGKGIACADGAAHSLLQSLQVVIDLDLLRMLSRRNFQHGQGVFILFHYQSP